MKTKNYIIILLLFLILLSLIFRIVLLKSDFSGDEIDFVRGAQAIINTGHPIFYHSEQEPVVTALWHPPMYIYTLALFFKLFGTSEISARILNFIFILLIGLLIFLFCRNNFKEDENNFVGITSVSLFYLTYYCFTSSMIIDIDVFSTFFIFALIFATDNYLKKSSKINSFLISLALFFSLWNRYPIAILIYLAMGIYLLIRDKSKIKDYILAGLFAGLLFLLVWTVYVVFLEPGNFFSFIKHNAKLGSAQFSNLKLYFFSFILNLAQMIRLITVAGFILLILTIFYFLKSKDKRLNLLLISSLVILIFFIILPRPAFGYPRYFLSAFPSITILISARLWQVDKDLYPDKRAIIIIILALFISFLLLIFLAPNSTLYRTDGLIRATSFADFTMNLLCSLPIILILGVKRKIRFAALIVLIFSMMLLFSIYFDFKLTMDHPKIKETGEYIKNITSSQDKIIATKAVAYYAQRKFFGNDENKPPISNLSLSFIKSYLLLSYKTKNMDNSFFYGGTYLSGVNPPMPPKEKLDNATLVVLYYPLNDLSLELKIGPYYLYRLK